MAKMRFRRNSWAILGAAGLFILLGLPGCAGPPPLPPLGVGQVEPLAVTPDAAREAQCQRHYQEAVRICEDLYNCPDATHYRDEAWRRQCLEQARMQYESCLSAQGR